ncbi:hypothetical protein MYX76_04325 [Desulfobacterota bacterium AH_259_B03_O07]|nr:hypothetical protein [Desulfobacterota bacterium AH_259_B03_O07]
MSKAKWLVLFILALCIAVPSYAVELTLGGFPSYMRTRAHFIGQATFVSSLSPRNARTLGFSGSDDFIQFIDTRLRLTPQLVLSDSVTIRAQVDVADNMIWGGFGSGFAGTSSNNPFSSRSDVIFSSLTPSDRFRGALLTNAGACANQPGSTAVCSFALGNNTATDNVQFFNVRMLHMDVVLPNNLGFVRIGRQPFDWGLGIMANGGWDPQSDLGFVLDRFLYLKSFALGDGSFTFVFVSDKFTQGQSLINGVGESYDYGAVALIYNMPNLMGTNFTIGGYVFPYIHQDNIFSGPPATVGAGVTDLNLDRLTLWAGLIDIKTDLWRLVAEYQNVQGEVALEGDDLFDITAHNLLFAIRAEVYPGWPVKIVAAEFGYAGGDDVSTTDIEGNVITFSAAYNLDNLMFRHMLPNIYRQEGSVINAFYARAWATVKLLDSISVTPQVVVAWNEETSSPLFAPGTFGFGTPENPQNTDVSRYLGTEIELTGTWQVHPGVNFDLIGSLVINGDGMQDLLEQQAVATFNQFSTLTSLGTEINRGDVDAQSVAWAIQARVLIYIDQFFK